MNPKEGADRGKSKEEKDQTHRLRHPLLHHLHILPLLAQVPHLNRTKNITQSKPKECIKTTKSQNFQPNNSHQKPFRIKIPKTNLLLTIFEAASNSLLRKRKKKGKKKNQNRSNMRRKMKQKNSLKKALQKKVIEIPSPLNDYKF